VSDGALDWIIKVNQALFSIVFKGLVSKFVSRVAKERVTPLIEETLNNEVDLGGASKFKMFVVGQPKISEKGLDIALGIHRLEAE
jgi:hypothetical protein